jgi:ketosteroid isomerase-like protein
MSDTREVVEAFFAKSGANDLSIVDLFAEELEFVLPGNSTYFPWAGRHTKGGAALIDVFKSVWASRTPGKGSVVSSRLIVEGQDAAWFGVGVGHEMNDFSRRKGERFTIDVAMHFTVRDGKIIRLHVIEDMTALAADHGFARIHWNS